MLTVHALLDLFFEVLKSRVDCRGVGIFLNDRVLAQHAQRTGHSHSSERENKVDR